MDLVGPLEPSSRGHKHILVIVDYATRYPEAIPLIKVSTKVICEHLVELFTRVGFPKEILTDQGTPFMCETMKQVCATVQIQQIRTSVYHPETDGLVERYNQPIKVMLKKTLDREWKHLNTFIPLLMYAVRSGSVS